MYLWSTEQNQPLTPGLRWIKSNKNYRKQYLATGGSFKALQYLYYQQALLDRAGYNVNIEHAYFQGEKYVYGYKCDGYVSIDGREIVYEFHGECRYHVIIDIKIFTKSSLGCFFHGCSCIKKRTRAQMKAVEKWEKKKRHLQSKKVEIKLMRECTWDMKLKNEPHISQTKTKMARILKNDTEETLLEAIRNDEIFGFAVCSVKTDPSDIEQMIKVTENK